MALSEGWRGSRYIARSGRRIRRQHVASAGLTAMLNLGTLLGGHSMRPGLVRDRIYTLFATLPMIEQRRLAKAIAQDFAPPLTKAEAGRLGGLAKAASTEVLEPDASPSSTTRARPLAEPPSTAVPGEVLGEVSPTPPVLVVSEVLASSNGNHGSKKLQDEAIQILTFLNSKTGKNYRAVETNLILVRARLKSGASSDDIRGVIARKVREWKGTEMEKYLRPATLFAERKFEQYIGEQGT